MTDTLVPASSANSSINPAANLKSIPEAERPRERLLGSGGAALADAELVAVLLRCGRRGQSVLDMAREVLADHGGLAGLLSASSKSVRRNGLGRAKAASLLAAVEIGRRLARARLPERRILSHPEAVAGYLLLRYGQLHQEVMGAVYLDVRGRLLADVELFRGTLSRAAVEPRAILKEAIERGASSLVLFHTHPSGDPTPSLEDIDFTRRLEAACNLLDLELADHLILGSRGKWLSMRRLGAW